MARTRTATAMPEITRTLVKSAPELWAELSDPDALARHLAAFAPLTITDAATEQSLTWEAEHARGQIRLEPSGFGTKLTLTTEIAAEPAPTPEAPSAPEPPRLGLLARLLGRRPAPVEAASAPPPPPAPPQMSEADAEAALTAMLDTLGTARHRPFSRA